MNERKKEIYIKNIYSKENALFMVYILKLVAEIQILINKS